MKSKNFGRRKSNQGFSLIELLISMTITLVMVIAASLVYLSVRESDSAQSKSTDSIETGNIALQLIGSDLAQAGSYPAIWPTTNTYFPEGSFVDTYPPTRPMKWIAELNAAAYQSAIFGCDGGTFNSTSGNCDASVAIPPYRNPPDSIVINHFSIESRNQTVGNRKDCGGADPSNDTVNQTRRLNSQPNVLLGGYLTPTVEDWNLPPYLPVFVSNRYRLNQTSTEINKQPVNTLSLECNGNGANGSTPGATTTNVYQPMLLGIEDMQITYGVFEIDFSTGSLSLTPVRFITAPEVTLLAPFTYEYKTYGAWDQVSAVRICFMTKTLGDSVRIRDNAGANNQRQYLDCTDDTPQRYAATDTSIRKRHVQVFPLRNRLTQVY